MARLTIETYSCEKATSKTCAVLTFLVKEDCIRFLEQHGQSVSPRSNTCRNNLKSDQIYILGSPIYFSLNKRPLDLFSIRSLDHEAKQKATRSKQLKAQPDDELDDILCFHAISVACGVWGYTGPELVFSSHLSFPWSGDLQFGSRKVRFEAATGQVIEIAYSCVQLLTAADSAAASMTFSLREAPHFSEKDPLATMMARLALNQGNRAPKSQDIRVTSFGSKHAALVSGCLVYRFGIATPHVREKLNKIRCLQGFPEVTYHLIRSCAPSEMWESQWSRLRKALAEAYNDFPYSILFQIQRYVIGTVLDSLVSDLLQSCTECLSHTSMCC